MNYSLSYKESKDFLWNFCGSYLFIYFFVLSPFTAVKWLASEKAKGYKMFLNDLMHLSMFLAAIYSCIVSIVSTLP